MSPEIFLRLPSLRPHPRWRLTRLKNSRAIRARWAGFTAIRRAQGLMTRIRASFPSQVANKEGLGTVQRRSGPEVPGMPTPRLPHHGLLWKPPVCTLMTLIQVPSSIRFEGGSLTPLVCTPSQEPFITSVPLGMAQLDEFSMKGMKSSPSSQMGGRSTSQS